MKAFRDKSVASLRAMAHMPPKRKPMEVSRDSRGEHHEHDFDWYADRRLPIAVLASQIAMIILYGCLVEYHPAHDKKNAHINEYAFFQDVHIMIFIGFGFLMTFLRRYGYGAVAYNMLFAVIAIQWSIIVQRLLLYHTVFHLKFLYLIEGDIAAAAVLISYGAVIGRLTPFQIFIMTIIEVVFYSLNFELCIHHFMLADPGASIVVHTFGAYFGIAVSSMHWKKFHVNHKQAASSYHSNLFSMVGTIFLWIAWPSFNACLCSDPANQYRAVLNTYFSLCSSTMFTFAFAQLLQPKAQLGMEFIQNATLAGGVAAGALADQAIGCYGAMLVGATAGTISTLGFHYLTPFFNRHRIYDSCGVHNLHGMPGVISAFASAIAAASSTQAQYDYGRTINSPDESNYKSTFPQIAVSYTNITSGLEVISEGRSPHTQAGYQIASLVVTWGIAIGSGLLTGLFLKIPYLFPQLNDSYYVFSDEPFWEIPLKDSYEGRRVSISHGGASQAHLDKARNISTVDSEDDQKVRIDLEMTRVNPSHNGKGE